MTWHKLPTELQKYFILMIRNMQKPLYYHGFEVARLDLQMFSKVSMPSANENFEKKKKMKNIIPVL